MQTDRPRLAALAQRLRHTSPACALLALLCAALLVWPGIEACFPLALLLVALSFSLGALTITLSLLSRHKISQFAGAVLTTYLSALLLLLFGAMTIHARLRSKWDQRNSDRTPPAQMSLDGKGT